MTDRYENIRQALADMDAAAEARNWIAWRDAHSRFVVHVPPDTIRALLAERDALDAALEAAREDAARYRKLSAMATQQADYLGPIFRIDVRRSAPYLFNFDAAVDAAP